MSFDLTIESRGLQDLIDSIGQVQKNLTKEIGIINWEVGKKVKSEIAKSVSQELNAPQKTIKEKLKQTRGVAGQKWRVVVTLKKSGRLTFKQFKPTPFVVAVYRKIKALSKKAIARASKSEKATSRLVASRTKKPRKPMKMWSFSVKISKKRGRKKYPGTFSGPKAGLYATKLRGHVWRRKGEGKLPIVIQKGPSPWGVWIKGGDIHVMPDFIKKELLYQARRRLRYQRLKAKGTI